MAVSSPSSSSIPHSGTAFLPGFLMGDPMPTASPSSTRLWSTSPTKTLTPSSLGPKDSTPRFDRSESRNMARGSMTHTPKDKSGAPPVAGLFDNVDAMRGSPAVRTSYTASPDNRRQTDLRGPCPTPLSASFSRTPMQNSLGSASQLQSHGGGGSFFNFQSPTPASPAQIDPFYTQGDAISSDEQLNDTWVTVFGVPSAAVSFIIQQFSQYGNIVKHVVASNGNWLHIQYTSKIQAKKALSKNGKIFGNSIMVGVTPCIDKSVIDGTSCHSNRNQSSSTLHLDSPTPKTPIRPLTSAYKTVSSEIEVVPDSNTPKKSNNVITKTMEYMFGW
ncbi:nucleoporin NUP35-like [Anneissia japonica]|uniref:nucleoporin NUP35-like n=1 Tax=Anneissia japonica TaxID=1529436 RepID=UPI001425B88B|nr:nucleoporin NUP35-like [Anneissia japonica]